MSNPITAARKEFATVVVDPVYGLPEFDFAKP
jgi:hypothetical protein